MIINSYFFYGFVILMLIIILCIFLENIEFFLTYLTSTINNKQYGIQDTFNNTQMATDMLAQIHTKMNAYSTALKKTYPYDKRVIRMFNRLNNVVIEEAPDEKNSSTYTINKGEIVAVCLRPKLNNGHIDNFNFHDDNTLWFVIAHELAHIMSISEGHGSEFIENFKFILKTSHDLGYYNNPVDYRNKPITYCGVKVTNNPYY